MALTLQESIAYTARVTEVAVTTLALADAASSKVTVAESLAYSITLQEEGE